jgi:hypothetical protein
VSAAGRSAAAETGHVRHADDSYATPAWCTRAILPHLTPGSVLDPCCGDGAILDVVRDAWSAPQFGIEIDAVRARKARCGRSRGIATDDALDQQRVDWPDIDGGNIITNPPYRLAMQFVARALHEIGRGKPATAAFLLRLNFLGAQSRADFHRAHPADVYVLPRRPSFTGGGTDATEYAWFVWGPGRGGRWSILDVEDRP